MQRTWYVCCKVGSANDLNGLVLFLSPAMPFSFPADGGAGRANHLFTSRDCDRGLR